MDFRRKYVSSQRTSSCKSPEVGVCWECPRNSKEVSVVGQPGQDKGRGWQVIRQERWARQLGRGLVGGKDLPFPPTDLGNR